ncbi:MoaD/ThiS family protein, partial [Cronobacter sakazakii]|nr:MoaD/ThiS family protein [Cronobacter sakazakii]
RGGGYALGLGSGTLLAAVTQTLVPFDHPIADGDEVAFFPPVTGG